jgi:hypothetical protein
MTEAPEGSRDAQLQAALERALPRVLSPPALPAQFHTRLQAALTRAQAAPGLSATRQRFERERRELLQELQAGYVRVRQRTLVAMIGAAFVAGALALAALPWMEAHFGSLGPAMLAGAGAAVGLVIGFAAWRERLSL